MAAVHSVIRVVGGVELHALEAGSGAEVLLLHAEPGDSSMFSAVIPPLAVDHRVVALDLRGHGRSAKPNGDYSIPTQASYVERFLSVAGIDDAVVVGNSYGGILAMYLAANASGRVRGLVLCGTNAYRSYRLPWPARAFATRPGRMLAGLVPGRVVERAYRAQFADPAGAPATQVRAVCAAAADPVTRRCLWQQAHALDLGVIEPLLRAIRAPTLLIWGRDDPAVDLRWAERLASDIPGARLEVLDACGHYPPLEQPAAFAQLTRSFVATLPC
jgi:pimeloyl-ACP methyl ester carboxylesterase